MCSLRGQERGEHLTGVEQISTPKVIDQQNGPASPCWSSDLVDDRLDEDYRSAVYLRVSFLSPADYVKFNRGS